MLCFFFFFSLGIDNGVFTITFQFNIVLQITIVSTDFSNVAGLPE